MTAILWTAGGVWCVFYGGVFVVARRKMRRRALPRPAPRPPVVLPDPWQHPGWCYEVVKAGAWVHQEQNR